MSHINNKIIRTYNMWKHMLQRCYDPQYHEWKPTYKDCTVDPQWFNYQVFCEDIKLLPRYDEWLLNTNKDMELDKDIRVDDNKRYSPLTCMFVTRAENTAAAHLTGETYVAQEISTGNEIEFENQSAFAKANNFHQSGISLCILGKQEEHKGYTFRIK